MGSFTPNSSNTVSLVYVANGAGVLDMPEGISDKKSGSTSTVPTTIPSKEGSTFLGWNTKADGSGTYYEAGTKITLNEGCDLTPTEDSTFTHNTYQLFAIWESTNTGTENNPAEDTDTEDKDDNTIEEEPEETGNISSTAISIVKELATNTAGTVTLVKKDKAIATADYGYNKMILGLLLVSGMLLVGASLAGRNRSIKTKKNRV